MTADRFYRTPPAPIRRPVEVTIATMNGAVDPPPIAITFKQGPNTLIRVELSPADFALAVTGRLVIGEITRGMEPAAVPTTPKGQREP